VLICTGRAHHGAILEEFPQLAPHEVLAKWLYIDSRHAHFEATMDRVAQAIARGDQRFGIDPRPRREKPSSRSGGQKPRPSSRRHAH
jgi:hypothetical protein